MTSTFVAPNIELVLSKPVFPHLHFWLISQIGVGFHLTGFKVCGGISKLFNNNMAMKLFDNSKINNFTFL